MWSCIEEEESFYITACIETSSGEAEPDLCQFLGPGRCCCVVFGFHDWWVDGRVEHSEKAQALSKVLISTSSRSVAAFTCSSDGLWSWDCVHVSHSTTREQRRRQRKSFCVFKWQVWQVYPVFEWEGRANNTNVSTTLSALLSAIFQRHLSTSCTKILSDFLSCFADNSWQHMNTQSACTPATVQHVHTHSSSPWKLLGGTWSPHCEAINRSHSAVQISIGFILNGDKMI